MTAKFSFSSISIRYPSVAILMASLFGLAGTVQTAWGQAAPTVSSAAKGKKQQEIVYHGGPVMLSVVNIYYIFYGTWDPNAIGILTDLASNISNSNYYDINTTYFDGAGNHVSGLANFGGSTNDNYSQGTALSDVQVQQIVFQALTSGVPFPLPTDPNGVYFVLTSADVSTPGFCTQYCAFHTHGTINGKDIKYAFVGNADRCPAACSAQATSPNGNAGADAMANQIAAKLSDAVTDPDLNAWFDGTGIESGDKCSFNFGTTFTEPNGSRANVTLGARDYLLQQLWRNVGKQPPGGFCALSP